jgi:hypothetical protein
MPSSSGAANSPRHPALDNHYSVVRCIASSLSSRGSPIGSGEDDSSREGLGEGTRGADGLFSIAVDFAAFRALKQRLIVPRCMSNRAGNAQGMIVVFADLTGTKGWHTFLDIAGWGSMACGPVPSQAAASWGRPQPSAASTPASGQRCRLNGG